jgi:F-type H+-transporting ATPase subunit b
VVAAAQRQIQQETARAMQEIRRETVDLSLQIASKLIRKNLTPEDNDALIRESLAQIDARH